MSARTLLNGRLAIFERHAALISLGMVLAGMVIYFALQLEAWLFYPIVHLGAAGILGLFGSAPGLLAKKKGMIPECRPVMEDLMRGGMYLSRRILDEALKRVDE